MYFGRLDSLTLALYSFCQDVLWWSSTCSDDVIIHIHCTHHGLCIFSSPEPKAHGELIVYQSSRRLSVCLSVCLCVHIFKHEYL